jgi:probable F420-dependent oxidoreductase
VRFGLQLPTYGPTAEPGAIARTAGLAESLGFDSVWTNDHVLVPSRLTNPYGRIFEAITTLAWVAAWTERLRLGVSVLILPQRDPILAAKQLATLDVLSDGRLIAGFAAGYVEEEFAFLRAPFRERGRLLVEYLEAMRALWRGEPSFAGEHVSFDDAVFGPLPAQGARVPVWLGGTSTAALRRAAAHADAWHPAGIDAQTVAAKHDELRTLAGAREIGVALKIRTRLAGTTRSERQSASAAYFPDAVELAGSPDDLVGQLDRYRAAGVTDVVTFFFHKDEAELARALGVYAAEVMPQLRPG